MMTAHTEGGQHSMSDSEWMEGVNFNEWFRKVFLEGRVLKFFSPLWRTFDVVGLLCYFLKATNHNTTLGLVEEAQDQGIGLYTFPSHITHLSMLECLTL